MQTRLQGLFHVETKFLLECRRRTAMERDSLQIRRCSLQAAEIIRHIVQPVIQGLSPVAEKAASRSMCWPCTVLCAVSVSCSRVLALCNYFELSLNDRLKLAGGLFDLSALQKQALFPPPASPSTPAAGARLTSGRAARRKERASWCNAASLERCGSLGRLGECESVVDACLRGCCEKAG